MVRMTGKQLRRLRARIALLGLVVSVALGGSPGRAQDVLSSQLRQGFGKNKVRYSTPEWLILESEHLELLHEEEFQDLAHDAVLYLEQAYAQISDVLRHQLSTKPPIVIFKSSYDFQQTNIIHEFLPPGVAGFAEPLRYRMVIPFNGDLDAFRDVLTHELCHIFQYDVLYKGPIKRLSNPLSAPPTWLMEGQAEYVTEEMNTIDEMVLRDAVLTDRLIPLEVMDGAWGTGNVFLAYKQSHSLMEYIADNYGPEKISRLLRVWDSQNDTDKLLERLLDVDMETLHERWSAHMRKQYWPLLQNRDYLSELGDRVVEKDENYTSRGSPRWSLSGDMLAVLSSDGVEQHVDIIRVQDASLVERITERMRTADYDDLTFGSGTVAWAPDGHTIAFVAKDGPKDLILVWDFYRKEITQSLSFDHLEIIESLDWDPTSRRLAFAGTGYAQTDIYVVDVATGQLQQLTGTPQRDTHPAWSPDGARIAFSSKCQHQFDIKVYEMETGETDVLVQTPTDDLWPNWLPEGNKLLFVSTRDRINDLFVYHLEEQQEYRLTRTLSGIMSPALSPDGRRIALNTYHQGQSQLYVMDMPAWPELKKRSAELIARATLLPAPADPPPASGPEQPALADARVAPGSNEPVALADQKQAPASTERLVYRASDHLPAAEITPDSASPATSADADGDTPGEPPIPESESGPATSAADSLETGDGEATSRRPTVSQRRYTPKLEFDGLSLQMGYYDGFFSSVGMLSMSDLLGNHSLALATNAVASQEVDNDFNFAATYAYYGRRPTYNVAIFNWNQFFNDNSIYLVGGGLARGVVRNRQSGMMLDVSYPRDIYRRIDLTYTFVSEHEQKIWPETEDLGSRSTHLAKAAYVHDSISYGLLGPTAGRRYFLSVGRTLQFSNSDRSFSHLEMDYRHYLRLGRWTVLGLRAAGVGSLGPDGLEYYLGGPTWFLPFYTGFNLNTGPLRGYQFSEFTGSRVVLMNAEVRVPFIRQIAFGWPAVFAIPAVDGSLFMDVGAAWNDGESLDPWPLHNPHGLPEAPGEDKHLRAGVGFGLLVYFLLPMNFEFAKRTDLQGRYSDYHMHFSFGRSF